VGGDETLLHHIFRPFRRGNEMETEGPAGLVRVDPLMRGVLRRWHKLILNCPGCATAAAASPTAWAPTTRRHRIRSDAALLGTEAPGLGGWLDGEWWCVPLDSVPGLELLDIPHLEFLAAAVAILVWARRLQHAELVELETDALATAISLTARAKSPKMQVILDELLRRELYKLLAQRLRIVACMGAGNPLADAASRGYAETLGAITGALGIEARKVELPTEARQFLTDVLDKLAALRPGGGLGSTALSSGNLNLKGDEPIAHGGDPPPPSSPPMPRTPEQATARTGGGPPPSSPPRPSTPGKPGINAAARPPSSPTLPSAPSTTPPQPASPMAISPDKAKVEATSPPLPSTPTRAAPAAASERATAGSSANAEPPPASPHYDVPSKRAARGPPSPAGISSPPLPSSPPRKPSPGAVLEAPRPPRGPLLAKKVKGISAIIGKMKKVRMSVAESVFEMLRGDTSEDSIGACDEDLRWMAELAVVGDCDEAPLTSQSQLASNWKHWLAFCARFKVASPLRPDLATLDVAAVNREKVLWTAALTYIYAYLMKPARGKFLLDGTPKPVSPESAMAVLRGVRRIHIEAGIETPPLKLAAKRLLELMRLYAKDVGPENVAPQRKAPLTHALIMAMLRIPDGSAVLAEGRPWYWSTLYGRSCRTAIHVLAQCGFRKAEIALASGAEFDKLRVSWANVTWWFDKGTRETATPELKDLLSLQPGDYCGFIPPPSKADQFGRKWMNNTIWLPYSATAPINAARALAQYEIVARVPPNKRRSTPLFCGAGSVLGTSLASDAFSTLIHRLLAFNLGVEEAHKYSVHSFRSYLASAMVAAGCSDGEVQAALRWASEDALKVYKVSNKEQYGGWLLAAEKVKLTGVRLAAMPRPPPEYDNERRAALVLQTAPTVMRTAEAGDTEDIQRAAIVAARMAADAGAAAARAARPPVVAAPTGRR